MNTGAVAGLLSPLGLLMAIFVAIHIAVPVGSWLMLSGRRDDKVLLWFSGLSVFCFSVVLITLRPVLPPLVSFQISWILSCIGGLLMYESFRRESGLPNTNGITPLLVFTTWTTLHLAIYLIGETDSWGVTLNSAGIAVYCFMLFFVAGRVRKASGSGSLVLFQLALVLLGVPSAVRVMVYLLTGDTEQVRIFKFTWISIWLSFAYIMAIMFLSISYLGFVFEKSIRERNVANVEQRRAEGLVGSLLRLIEERNHLLLMNSRFSTVNEFGSLSAMVVHDLAQPLQRLSLNVARVKQMLKRSQAEPGLHEMVRQLEATSDEAIEVVGALRSLVGKNTSELGEVPVARLRSASSRLWRARCAPGQSPWSSRAPLTRRSRSCRSRSCFSASCSTSSATLSRRYPHTLSQTPACV